MVVVFCKWCYPYLLGLSKRNARVEIPDSLFFVRSQIAVKSSLRMRSLLTLTREIRLKRLQNVHTSFVLDPH